MDDTKLAPPKRLSLLERFTKHIQSLLPLNSHICVGLSGGLDSMVLLQLLSQLRAYYPMQLSAVHVHHGLHPQADLWLKFCDQACAERGIPFTAIRIALPPHPVLGIEAAARQARYTAYTQQAAAVIALAHHKDDQGETLLLQLLRGAGVKGLAAMPAVRALSTRQRLLRPLLIFERSELHAWATQQHLTWVEDDSNQDSRYARNFLRHQVFPLLEQQYPAWRNTLTRSTQHLAEAGQLLDDLAEMDAQHCLVGNQLNCTYLAKLSTPRARNLLRYFLAQHQIEMPSERRLVNIHHQLVHARNDAQIQIELGAWVLRRYRKHAFVLRSNTKTCPQQQWQWQGEKLLDLPELSGQLHFNTHAITGISLQRLGAVTLRLRQGGEHFQPDCQRPKRALKDLWQEFGTPPWEREQLPLLYSDEQLVWVPNLGIACGWEAQTGESALAVSWINNLDTSKNFY